MAAPIVLVFDQDPNILEALGDFFRKEGMTMLGVQDISEALQILNNADQAQKIQLLVLDVGFDEFSGLTLLQEKKNRFPNLSVIVLSAFPELLRERDLKSLGMNYLFLKPLDIGEFRKAIRNLLSHQ